MSDFLLDHAALWAEQKRLKTEWDKAFSDLKAAGVDSRADDPIAARYREASNAVNHVNRKLDRGLVFEGYDGPPHPDYPNMVWSDPRVEPLVVMTIKHAESPAEAARAIQKILDSVGYDSMDREMAFWIATQLKGWDYDAIYDAWLDAA